MAVHYPDYDHCLVNVACSIQKRFGIKPVHASLNELDEILKRHDKIVFILFDGLGRHPIEVNAPKKSIFRTNRIIPITSVYPPTTVAATNAFLAGKYPAETGWLGWTQYFADRGQADNVFLNFDPWNDQPIPGENIMRARYGYTDIFHQVQEANPDVSVHEVWPGFVPDGAKTTRIFFKRITKAIAKKQKALVYAYWPEPDHTIHFDGVEGKKTRRTIHRLERKTKRLVHKNRDTLFILLADHGLTDITYLDIREHPEFYATLMRPFALEPRAATFWLRAGTDATFKAAFERFYGKYFILKSKKEVLDEGLFGPVKMKADIQKFLGDYVALAIDKYAFNYSFDGNISPMIAHHAGLLDDEIDINLTIINDEKARTKNI